MSRSYLALVVAIPLLLALIALVGIARLSGEIDGVESSGANLAATQSAAINSLAGGAIKPSGTDVAAVLKSSFEAAEAQRKLVVSLWSMLKAMAWVILGFSAFHVLLCRQLILSHQNRGKSAP